MLFSFTRWHLYSFSSFPIISPPEKMQVPFCCLATWQTVAMEAWWLTNELWASVQRDWEKNGVNVIIVMEKKRIEYFSFSRYLIELREDVCSLAFIHSLEDQCKGCSSSVLIHLHIIHLENALMSLQAFASPLFTWGERALISCWFDWVLPWQQSWTAEQDFWPSFSLLKL